MKRRQFAGFDVVVENEAGSVRQWRDRAAGLSGETVMECDYGYLEGHVGSDGEEVDVYLGSDESASFVYVVHQLKTPDYKTHDEDKVFLGYNSEIAAKTAYLAHRSDGEKAYGGMSAIPLERFKAKLSRRTGAGKIRHSLFEEDKTMNCYATFDATRGPNGRVRCGVWDRVCVPGVDEKDGQSTVFNDDTLGQMVDNFVDRGDQIPIDANHQSNYAHVNGKPAPALGFYGALAVVWGGKIAKSGAARGVSPVGVEGLDLTKDGLWAYRSEVTELGDELLPNFKYVSPTFISNGTKRDGTEVGYSLAAVAATNTPWQSQTLITFNGASSAQGEIKMAKLAKLAKFVGMEGAGDDAAIKQALAKKMEDSAKSAMGDDMFAYEEEATRMEEAARAYEDAHYEDDAAGEPPHVTMRKMAAKFRKLAKTGDAKSMEDPPFGGKETPSEEAAEEKAKMEADGKDEAKMQALEAILKTTQTRLSQLEAEKTERVKAVEAARERELEQFADHVIAGGYPKDKRGALIKFARVDFEGAKATVEHLLPQGAPSHLFDRVTRQGGSLGGSVSAREEQGPSKPRVVKSMGVNFVEDDADFASEIRKLAESKEPAVMAKLDKYIPNMEKVPAEARMYQRLLAAEKIVRAERPDLAETADQ